MYLNNCYCLITEASISSYWETSEIKKKELMELTGNCCIMSLTVVFIIAQGKIEKKLYNTFLVSVRKDFFFLNSFN